MSRSSPKLEKPASRYLEYKAQEGVLQYYDKDKAETFAVPFPFEFLVLDELNTITGFERPQKASYYSNEVRNSTKEPFTIMLKGQQVYHGLYKNEQKVVQVPRAAKYTKSIYVAYKDGKDWQIGNIKLAGSAMTAWIEFTQHLKVQDSGKVVMTKGEKVKGEQSDYYPPAFQYVRETSKEEEDAAYSLDQKLQAYLTQYFINQGTPDDDSALVDEIDDSDTKATPAQLAEFEALKEKQKQPLKADDFPDDDPDFASLMQAGLRADDIDPNDVPPEFR